MSLITHFSRVLLVMSLAAILAMAHTNRKGYALYREVKRAGVSSPTLIEGTPAGSSGPIPITIPSSSALPPPPPPQVTTSHTTTTTSSTPTTTTAPPASSAPPASATGQTTTSAIAPVTSTSPSTTTTAPVLVTIAPTQTVSVITLVSLVTENGSTFSKSIDLSTTFTVTPSPTALADSSSSSGGGLSSPTKAVIGGVVGGIGGAVVLAVLLAVLWRVRRNHQRNKLDPDDVMVNGSSAQGGVAEKDSTGSTPFKTTLESYHNPANKPVNASSNF